MSENNTTQDVSPKDTERKVQFLKPNCFIAFCRDDEKAAILTQHELQQSIEKIREKERNTT